MNNIKTYMVNFTWADYGQPSEIVQLWLEEQNLHKIIGILNFSASHDFSKLWMIIEADSESQLINVIEKANVFNNYDFDYHILEFTSSIINFSKFTTTPDL